MNSIIIQGRTLQYETLWVSYGEDICSSPVTIFYDGVKKVTYKKWGFFGPILERDEPREVFRIYADTENAELSKSWWRTRIENGIDLLDRKEEIEKGELI